MADRSLAAPGRMRGAAYLVSSNVIASACTFALAIVLARALGPTGKGYVDIVANSASLLATFTGLSLSSGILFHAAHGDLNHRRLLGALMAVAVAAGLATGALLYAGRAAPLVGWLLPDGNAARSIGFIAILLAVTHVLQFAQSVARGYGYFGVSGAADVVARGGVLAIALALTVAGVRAPERYVLATVAATAAAATYLVVRVWRSPAPATHVPWRGMILYSLPLFLGNAVQFLNYRLDVFFVKNYLGLTAVGQYTVAVSLTQALWLIPNALAVMVMRTTAAEGRGRELASHVALVNRFCLALSAAGAAALAAAASGGLTSVFGERFRDSVGALVLLAPGTVLFAQTIILSAFLNGVRKQAYTTVVACGSLVATIALDIALIPRLGIAGAALASTVSYLASSVATLVLVRRELPDVPVATFLLPQRADWARAGAWLRASLARVRYSRATP